MKLNIKATNLKLTGPLFDYLENKIGGLEKFIQKIDFQDSLYKKGKPPYEAWVEIARMTRHHKEGNVFRAEVQVRLPGKSLRSEAEGDDLKLCICEVKDELQREFKEYVEKQSAKQKRAIRKIKRQFRMGLPDVKGARVRIE